MGSNPLRQFLVSLCNDTRWKYSVFWKFNQQTPLCLTFEDGYYDDTKPEGAWEIKSCYNSTERSPIGLLVANMSRFQYAFGEGLVGTVACTGNHMWVSVSREFESKLVPNQTNEWLLQISLGVKTVLLVPALPYGVIQLGSFEEVIENAFDVGMVKDRFEAYCYIMETIPIMVINNQPQVERVEGFDSECMNGIKSEFDCFEESIFPSLYSSGNNLDVFEEELLSHSLSVSQNMEFFGESLNEVLDEVARYPFGEMEAQLFESDYIDAGTSMEILYKFHEDGELHKALGSTFHENEYEKMLDSSFLTESNRVYSNDRVEISDQSEYLLEAVITNLFSSSDDSCITTLRKSSSFSQPHVESKEVTKIENYSDQRNNNLSIPVIFGRVDSSASLDGMTSTLTNEEQRLKGHSRAPPKGKKASNAKTSRGKNGNAHRPRPRDRQLIQDRVKELRELVPSGSKCSIDGLLDRTIKHMMYLGSVADQAEKLKGPLNHEISSGKNRKLSESNSASQNGTSWAFECGTENPVCPIVVEDLETPGHMLIKVLCDDHGLFLEIAQLIRRLDLTILKGSMENHSSKIWAHFVVEAVKGFHRMEIFWPLLHLLQRKRSRISSRI